MLDDFLILRQVRIDTIPDDGINETIKNTIALQHQIDALTVVLFGVPVTELRQVTVEMFYRFSLLQWPSLVTDCFG